MTLPGEDTQDHNFVSGDQTQKIVDLKRTINKHVFFFVNDSNASNNPEEINLDNVEVLVDSGDQNWFKRAHIG